MFNINRVLLKYRFELGDFSWS